MRLTIERIRTLVLAAGVLLIVVLAAFLAIGKWRVPFNRRDIPKRLGIDIQQEANGVTYTQSHGGHTIFKIHASRMVQLRNQHATLHDVVIELYGQNGSGVDEIKGDEFDYDEKAQIATAAGPVEITLTRPAPPPGEKPKARPAAPATNSQIHVKTSGVVFDQKTGIVSTGQRVDFSSVEGSGTAMGASYNSDSGLLILNSAVELTTRRGAAPVELHAEHAEFNRDAETGVLQRASAQTRDRQGSAAVAQLSFRDDGSVERIDASGGLTISTAEGGRLAAPNGTMEFNEENQPRSAHLTGGVTMQSASNGRTISGSAPVMTLAFNADGELRHAHLEQGVEMHSEEESQSMVNGRTVPVELHRTWRSPVADVDFREAGAGKVEPAQVNGTGGVVLTGETRRGNAAPLPSRLAADTVTGVFGPNATLASMTGVGHASLEETTAKGDHNTATGDRLRASFTTPGAAQGASAGPQAAQIQTAQLDGNVTLVQQPGAQAGAKAGARLQPPLRAKAGRAVYEAAGGWLHLTLHPRVNDGGLDLTADQVDVSQESGDAFAHGDVKATWMGAGVAGQNMEAATFGGPGLGGRGPAHVIASEAKLNKSTGEATFRGHARLWQQENSIAGPVIVIDRQKQMLTATTTSVVEPVVAVLLSTATRPASSGSAKNGRASAPAVVRVRGGDFWYSDADRKAVMRAAPLPAVMAQSGEVNTTSNEVQLFLAPAGATKQAANGAALAQVERMVAVGHVLLTSQGRQGTGEQLAYTGQSGDYVLTGTASAPPRLRDPQRGNVTGAALIFNSRDDSVSIEGRGQATTTETTVPNKKEQQSATRD